MKPADAAPLVRQWVNEHGRAVEMTLARCGVAIVADRADLKQEVFATAFLTLLRGETIDTPGAWLKGCARKKASNHCRKESRKAPVEGGEVVSTMASPAQLAEDREAIRLAFECLDNESQDIVLAARAEGLSWDAIALERGITVSRARYLYTLAVTHMEAVLKREDSRTNKHRAVAFPILLAQVFDAIRAEVDSTPPELDRQVREGLDRFMEAAGAGGMDPDEAEPDQIIPPFDDGARHLRPVDIPDAQSAKGFQIDLFARGLSRLVGRFDIGRRLGRMHESGETRALFFIDPTCRQRGERGVIFFARRLALGALLQRVEPAEQRPPFEMEIMKEGREPRMCPRPTDARSRRHRRTLRKCGDNPRRDRKRGSTRPRRPAGFVVRAP